MGITEQDSYWMTQALELAKQAQEASEVPVGAVLVMNNQLISTGMNLTITHCDPTAHAEIVAIRNAATKTGNYRLTQSTLYVTLEPCAMCAGAMLQARISRLVYGAPDLRAGAIKTLYNVVEHPLLNHSIVCNSGCMEAQSANLLREFFQQKRKNSPD